MNLSENTDNNTMEDFVHPSMSDYYTLLTPFITLSIFVATLLFILNVAIFCTTMAKLRNRLQPPFLTMTVLLCSLYPVISLAALLTILVPKSWLVCHTVMHLSFTVGAVVFHRLCMRYLESELNYIKETDGAEIAINTPPCCCCCMCLPQVTPSRAKFQLFRYMVWQMPFVQGFIMLLLNIIYYWEEDLYASASLYFVPFIVCSIILGIWALNIVAGAVTKLYSEYGLKKKLFCLQLILLLCKFQYMVLDMQLNSVEMGGPYPINHTIYKQTIINLLILAEMVLVSLLVQNSYKIPIQGITK